jgi:hypothetical protein
MWNQFTKIRASKVKQCFTVWGIILKMRPEKQLMCLNSIFVLFSQKLKGRIPAYQ